MGKIKTARQKFHIASKRNKPENEDSNLMDTLPLPPQSSDNIFAGLNIDVANLKNKLADDVQSVKSFKSVKSEIGKNKLAKKEKLALRRNLLLKKIDTVNQMKKELKLRNKRKSTTLIGDTNPLHDALPSLESLLKSKSEINIKNKEPGKKKGIDKASKRKKNHIQSISIFKQTMKNKQFQKNPLEAISQHVKMMVEREKILNK